MIDNNLSHQLYNLKLTLAILFKWLVEIANEAGVTASYVLRTIQLGFLAPDIVRAILNGTHPATLTLKNLKQSIPLPIDWSE